MEAGMNDVMWMRIGIALAALVLFAVIVWSSRRKSAPSATRKKSAAQEPTLRELIEAETQDETAAPEAQAAKAPVGPEPELIVSLFLAARSGQMLSGSDLVVAAEKAGLVYGQRNIFHRTADQHGDKPAIFSMANILQPGEFDLRAIKEMRTPGVVFFMTLPGPMAALDAWETMLPTAQRMAELLDAMLLDDERNALGRQRIANIRDQMRAYDRARERLDIKPGR